MVNVSDILTDEDLFIKQPEFKIREQKIEQDNFMERAWNTFHSSAWNL